MDMKKLAILVLSVLAILAISLPAAAWWGLWAWPYGGWAWPWWGGWAWPWGVWWW